MARRCELTGKRPLVANAVSHANNKTKRRQLPNLQRKRFWSEKLGRFVRLDVTTKAIKTAGRVGIDALLARSAGRVGG